MSQPTRSSAVRRLVTACALGVLGALLVTLPAAGPAGAFGGDPHCKGYFSASNKTLAVTCTKAARGFYFAAHIECREYNGSYAPAIRQGRGQYSSTACAEGDGTIRTYQVYLFPRNKTGAPTQRIPLTVPGQRVNPAVRDERVRPVVPITLDRFAGRAGCEGSYSASGTSVAAVCSKKLPQFKFRVVLRCRHRDGHPHFVEQRPGPWRVQGSGNYSAASCKDGRIYEGLNAIIQTSY